MVHSDSDKREHTHGLGAVRAIFLGLGMLAAMLALWQTGSASQPVVGVSNPTAGSPQVSLSAASGARIRYVTHNNQAVDDVPPETLDIPHLVLTRNGALVDVGERTLLLTVSEIEVPPGGAAVTARLETQHIDPDQGSRLVVWQDSRWIDNPQDAALPGQSVGFTVEFGDVINSGAAPLSTPTDYYRYQVEILALSDPSAAPLHNLSQDDAFLLERQWSVPLQEMLGAAGPHELVVYFCDMFPFQKDPHDPASRLPRGEIPAYVQNELLPHMLAAIRLQTGEWGFSLEGWSASGRRSLAVALSDGETWFHAPAPRRGNAAISINVSAPDNAGYATLTDGLMSTFHHELFHNFQISLALSSGITSDFDGAGGAWQFFTEGTASFASSVGQPDIQFAQDGGARAYLAKAIAFVGGKGFPGDLNSSYAEMNPYHAAIYWRFLYEQCGGMSAGVDRPAVGMRLIRRTLQEFYARRAVDITTSADLVHGLPALMDRVFASPEASACPFRTFDESLVHFARAVHALSLDGGRCAAAGSPAGCGLYDPHGLYSAPGVSQLTYSGAEIVFSAQAQPYPAGIRSSFGMDFVDVLLRPSVQGGSLTLELHGDPTGVAEFNLQVVALLDGRVQPFPVQALQAASPGSPLAVTLPALDLAHYDRLGLIITRLDTDESLDPVGAYTLVVKPGS